MAVCPANFSVLSAVLAFVSSHTSLQRDVKLSYQVFLKYFEIL